MGVLQSDGLSVEASLSISKGGQVRGLIPGGESNVMHVREKEITPQVLRR